MITGFCHSCLKGCEKDFCSSCRKKLFNGKAVSAVLSFDSATFTERKLSAGERISISGVQIKHSLALDKNKLVLTEKEGEYILKPVSYGNFAHSELLPANEHLTMQVAERIFGINTAPNALVYFSDGKPAYITKRFDYTHQKEKLIVEDFAQISGKTSENSGENYKYSFSYEEIGFLIKQYVAASAIELEKFFCLVLFNYLISNGDAHLKNFSLIRNKEYGDYRLTPAYDLVCTRLHLPYESDMALELFGDQFESEDYLAGSKHLRGDFELFGERLGLKSVIITSILDNYISLCRGVEPLVVRSFLSEELKQNYLTYLNDKLSRFK